MVYEYHCSYCDLDVEIKKPMARATDEEFCSICGTKMERKFSPLPFSFGWKFSETSHLPIEQRPPGHKQDELVKNI